MNITKSEDQARYIADQALQAQAAGDLAAAELLLQQAEAIDPDVGPQYANANEARGTDRLAADARYGCSPSLRPRLPRSAPRSNEEASSRLPLSCAGCSRGLPIRRRRGTGRGSSPGGSRRGLFPAMPLSDGKSDGGHDNCGDQQNADQASKRRQGEKVDQRQAHRRSPRWQP